MPENATKATGLSNQAYDVVKFLAQIALPALGALYFAVAGFWGLPHAQEVVGTVVAVDTFLGVLLGISSKQYQDSEKPYDGELEIITDPDTQRTVHSLNLNPDVDVDTIGDRKQLTFKVNAT